MFERATQLSLKRRSLFVIAAFAAIAFALFELNDARVETLPDFNPPFVEVQTEALGLSAYEVEQLITVPLEADLLNGVAFVEDIRSQSIPGLSSIVMTFEPGTDLLDARQLVQERLTQAAGLPNVSRAPAMIQPLSSESRLMMIGLTSNDLSLIDLGVLARWTIRPRLMGVDGVANVAVWGQREQQLQVQVNLDKLAAEQIPMRDIVRTAGNALWVTPLTFLEASTPGVGGFIDGPNQRIGIRHVPAISTPEDLATVVIDGRPDLVLGDVATIVEDHQPLIGDAVIEGQSGVYLVVEKFVWSNTSETTEAVEEALAELEPGLVGVTVEPDLFRPASYLERAIDNIQFAVLIAMVLLALGLMLALGGWRSSVVVLLAVSASTSATAIVLYVLEVTFSFMIIAGLAIGTLLIVDNTIRNVMTGAGPVDRGPDALMSGSRRQAITFSYAAVVLVVSLVPALFMSGVAGEFVPPIGYAMALSLAVGLVVSLVISPALASIVIRSTPRSTSTAERLGSTYGRLLDRSVGAPLIAIAVTVAFVAVGAGLTIPADREFLPTFRQTDLLISFEGAPGLSLQETRRIASSATEELTELPGVRLAGIQVGRAILSDEVNNVNTSEIWVSLDTGADYVQTIDDIREVVDGYPGIDAPMVNTYANSQVDSKLRTPNRDLVVRAYGEQPEILRAVATDILAIVDGINGVSNVEVAWPTTEPSIEIEVDLDAAAAKQIKPGDVRRAAATAFSGIEVGSLFEDQRVFEVVVWSEPQFRRNITSIENLRIDTPSGEGVALSAVANVRVAPNERTIERDAVSRYIDIVADVPDRNIVDVKSEIRAEVASQGLPFEFHIGFVSDTEEAASDFRHQIAVGVAALVTILLVLQAAFASWRLAGSVAVLCGAALSGSMIALLVAGGTYSIGSMAGMVVVVGLTLTSSIGLIKRYESIQLDEAAEFGVGIVKSGAREHFWPTVVSATMVALVMMPFIFFGTVAGLEILHPLAIAVLGGVVTSTALTLLVVPAIYLRWAKPPVPEEHFGHRASGLEPVRESI